MKAVVVYESMYGNTHQIANVIGDGLRPELDVTVVPVEQASRELLEAAELLVVGGPTHVHGMSRESTRAAAAEAVTKPGNDLELDPDAEGPGLREWFDDLDGFEGMAAAFDTRAAGPATLTGRASKGIARRLRKHGASLVLDPQSFLVTKGNQLEADEAEHALAWGRDLARVVATKAPTSSAP